MSRKVLILTVEEAGVKYGRVVKASEMMELQDFAHEHIDMVTRDLLMKNAPAPLVSGFTYALAGGLNLTIAEGHAVDALGRSFQTLPAGQAAAVAVPAAHAAQPRIDLVYATLVPNQDSDIAAMPRRRVRTEAEELAGADPYPQQNANVATRRSNVAVVGVRQGVASANPAAPAVGAGEAPLYHVRVEANAVAITADKVTDVRNQMRSLRDAWAQLDVINANPAILGFDEAVDDRVNALIAVSGDLTKNYNDAANVLTLGVNFGSAAFNEAVDDRVAAMYAATPNTGLSLVYNDGAGTLVLSGVAATGAAMGMMSAADKTKLDAATEALTANALVRRDAAGDAALHVLNLGGAPTADVGHPFQLALRDDVTAYNLNPATGIVFATKYNSGGAQFGMAGIKAGKESAVDGETRGYLALSTVFGVAYTERLRIASSGLVTVSQNLNVVGAFTAGSKTFVIDHPLDPSNKDLVHAAIETNRHGLLYYVTATLDNETGGVDIDLDAALGFTPGTFDKLTQQAEVVSVRMKGGAEVFPVAGEIEHAALGGGLNSSTLSVSSGGMVPTGGDIVVLICAARKDPYIFSAPGVDVNGRLVAEQNKVAPTASELTLLDDVAEVVPEGDPRAGTSVDVVVTSLVGKAGYPRHPAAIPGGGEQPLQNVSFEEVTVGGEV